MKKAEGLSQKLSMKAIKLFLCLFAFTAFLRCNSGIENGVMNKLSKEEIGRIATLCKVWGGLKYFSVNTNISKIDWDAVLLSELSKNADFYKRNEDLNKIVKAIYDVLESDNIPLIVDSIVIANDSLFSWLGNDLHISNEVKTDLKKVLNTKHWVLNNADFKLKSDLPTFETTIKNELNELPNIEERYFALFSYWNFINYFSPYKNSTNGNWDLILEDFIPLIVSAENKVDYQRSFLKLFAKLNDGHAFCTCDINKNFDMDCNNLTLRNLVVKHVCVSNGSLRVGDSILSINGMNADSLVCKLKEIIPASNESYRNRLSNETLFKSLPDSISIFRIQVMRKNEIFNFKLNRDQVFSIITKYKSDTIVWKKIGENIVYINCGNIRSNQIREALASLHKKEIKLVLDLRKYPKDLLFDSFSYYIKHTAKPYVLLKGVNSYMPGNFITLDTYSNISNGVNAYSLMKCILLVDEFTMSHGEFSAMSYSTFPNTLVMGTQPAGADGDINTISLPGNIKTSYSGIGIYYPDGTPTQCYGVKIDLPIITSNNDDYIDLAVKYLNGK